MAKYVYMCVSVYVCVGGGREVEALFIGTYCPPGSLGVASTISKKYTLIIWPGSNQIH